MHVRKGDNVVVISGNDKGKRGAIKSVLLERSRVIVEGVNLRWKHRKPNQKSPKGERVQLECSIHSSNVMHLDPKTDGPSRRRPETKEQGAQRAREAKKAAKTSKKKEGAAS
jgi:large subunit ribosomal protein L24